MLCFREPGHDLSGWLEFIRAQIRRYAGCLATLQITEEANHAGPGGDGGFPAVRQALVDGVIAAKREVRRHGLDVRIGCNSTAVFDPAQEFWTDLGRRGGDECRSALDYAGLGFFPDVFQPVPAGRLPETVAGVLALFRRRSLAVAGIAESVPIHITEHGWGTVLPAGRGARHRRAHRRRAQRRTQHHHVRALSAAGREHRHRPSAVPARHPRLAVPAEAGGQYLPAPHRGTERTARGGTGIASIPVLVPPVATARICNVFGV
ncbi:hypothetical protein JCM9534A_61120 [Catenuloplanes indicus JCM 9534]